MKIFSYKTLILVAILSLFSTLIPVVTKASSMSDGLVAHWQLDETNGAEVIDNTSGFDGTLLNSAKRIIGKIGRALLFDQSNQSVNIDSDLAPLSSYSIAFWMKTTNKFANSIISDSTTGFSIFVCDNQTPSNLGAICLRTPSFNTSHTTLAGSTVVTDGNWHHIVVSYDSATGFVKVHVDGSANSSEGQWSWGGAPGLSVGGLRFNKTSDGGSGNYNGILDDVRVYNRALNAENNDAGDLFDLGSVENTTEPYLEFTSKPDDTIAVAQAKYEFVAQYGTTLVCKFDSVELAECNSPTNLTSLSESNHIFSVTAVDDETGNENTITDSFNVDFPAPFVPDTEGGNVGGADQNTNPGGFVPETDGGNTGGADQNTNPGGSVPDTDGGNTGGADTGSNNQNNEQNQQEAAQENSGSSGGASGSSKKSVVLALAATPKLPTLTDIGSCIYIKDYLNIKGPNNPTEVTKLQTFLLNTEGIDVPVNGIFDQATFDAVKAFQTKYLDDVMAPWGLKVASGVVSYTTKKKINEIYCKTTFSLTPEQLAAIESYKNRQTAAPAIAPENFVAPDNVEVGFVQPESNETQETPAVAEQATETPATQQTQTASALDAGGGFFQKIINFFKKIF